MACILLDLLSHIIYDLRGHAQKRRASVGRRSRLSVFEVMRIDEVHLHQEAGSLLRGYDMHERVAVVCRGAALQDGESLYTAADG